MKKIIIISILCFIICGCSNRNSYQTISVDSAKTKIKEGAYLIDVRSRQEYMESHIQGAINIPVDEIANPKKKIISKNDVIIVYCKSGGRSKQAADQLIDMGYQYVYDFGTMENWK